MKQWRMMLCFLALFLLLAVGGTVRAATLRDSDNRVIVFDHPFSRIISLYPAHTRNLLDMGLEPEKIVAVGRSDRQLDRPRVSFRDDPERLLALEPDLVLIRPMISRAYPQLVKRLEQSGVTVVSLQPASMDRLFWYWETLGRLTGKEDGVRAMIGRFGRELATIRRQVDLIPAGQRKKVYFEAIHRRMKTFAPRSMAIFVLESAGGINVAADALQVRNTNIAAYGKERILARASEIDVFLAQKGRMNPVTVEMIRSEPGFQVIKAVRNDQIYLVDEKLVSRPTLGLLTGIRTVFEILYPVQ
ncbi:ABC transporter substrate-binding protein [Desulfolithobacter dissulfuricans]|uniref:ABC transporter substrate-binding protein n=1 Tax=Desulfolithobacter dissulfuricans TaxID=2795293 RepID=A0A915U6I7_9BACT|nr:ABC transporter substrate-binding protein [Desulfolithobacter dissulfuricans]BCO10237.1 ABC transporter substrate-binding protein [Desulfolithobacter dissulfuricans]